MITKSKIGRLLHSLSSKIEDKTMIRKCKICEINIPVPKYGLSWWCAECNRYQIICLDNGIVESELITIDNYNLVFFPAYKEANVVEATDGHKIVRTFPMDELTHELANQWIGKLKTYVIFQ
jgi:hypothetical protein